MSEKPILFSGPMVRAILEDRKTQTRRVMKPQPTEQVYQIYKSADFAPRDRLDNDAPDFDRMVHCPYGAPSDRLWVRESWAPTMFYEPCPVLYRADHPEATHVPEQYGRPWKPSIHMPRWASRITLELTGVRVERVQEIGEADIKAEGLGRVRYRGYTNTKIDDPEDFSDLWDAINARRGYSWASNPWVWVLEFRRI